MQGWIARWAAGRRAPRCQSRQGFPSKTARPGQCEGRAAQGQVGRPGAQGSDPDTPHPLFVPGTGPRQRLMPAAALGFSLLLASSTSCWTPPSTALSPSSLQRLRNLPNSPCQRGWGVRRQSMTLFWDITAFLSCTTCWSSAQNTFCQEALELSSLLLRVAALQL